MYNIKEITKELKKILDDSFFNIEFEIYEDFNYSIKNKLCIKYQYNVGINIRYISQSFNYDDKTNSVLIAEFLFINIDNNCDKIFTNNIKKINFKNELEEKLVEKIEQPIKKVKI